MYPRHYTILFLEIKTIDELHHEQGGRGAVEQNLVRTKSRCPKYAMRLKIIAVLGGVGTRALGLVGTNDGCVGECYSIARQLARQKGFVARRIRTRVICKPELAGSSDSNLFLLVELLGGLGAEPLPEHL